MTYGIISADCHLDPEFLPRDAFTAVVPSALRDAVPQVKETPEGPTWFAGDAMLGVFGARRLAKFLAGTRRGTSMAEAGFDLDQARPGNPALRIEDQEKDGVDAELMYGPLRRWRYLAGFEPSAAAIIAGAYNEFIAGFCSTSPTRLYALGAVPPTEPAAMAKEIAHIAKLNLAGAEVSLGDADHPIWDLHWDPLWSASVEHGVPIHIHVPDASRTIPGPGSALVERAAFVCGIQMQLQPTLTIILLSGILERHPRLQVVFAEAGAGWIPYILDRIDYEWDNAHAEWQSICTVQPSELFRRQMFATFQEDAIGPQLAHLYPNNFLWGSDYPHMDGIWPDSQTIIRKTMGGLDEGLRKRIVHDNAVALYRIAT